MGSKSEGRGGRAVVPTAPHPPRPPGPLPRTASVASASHRELDAHNTNGLRALSSPVSRGSGAQARAFRLGEGFCPPEVPKPPSPGHFVLFERSDITKMTAGTGLRFITLCWFRRKQGEKAGVVGLGVFGGRARRASPRAAGQEPREGGRVAPLAEGTISPPFQSSSRTSVPRSVLTLSFKP